MQKHNFPVIIDFFWLRSPGMLQKYLQQWRELFHTIAYEAEDGVELLSKSQSTLDIVIFPPIDSLYDDR